MIRTKTKHKEHTKTIPKTAEDKSKVTRAMELIQNPTLIRREINKRSLYEFLKYFWDEVSPEDEFEPNWHIPYLCEELEKVARRVANKQPKLYDLIINIPPGMTKTILTLIMYPVWCWVNWYWMRFIAGSYGSDLSLESAEHSRDVIEGEKFQTLYPELGIREDKNTKSNYMLVKRVFDVPGRKPKIKRGGQRFSTSVGAKIYGFHAHIQLVDDPLNPKRAAAEGVSEAEIRMANHWVDQTLSTRKVNKLITPLILIMQRLDQDDPSGHLLKKMKQKGKKIRLIRLPGEINTEGYKSLVCPQTVIKHYKNGYLDKNRLNQDALDELMADLGEWGYGGQVGQTPAPPGGNMFKVDNFKIIDNIPNPPANVIRIVRFWDKAGTEGGGAYTAGVKIVQLTHKRWVVMDVIRGQWSTERREEIIRQTAECDGVETEVYIEQEPGSGGKESAENTIANLAGFVADAEPPRGNKPVRAAPFSVQVNWGNVYLLRADWNHEFIEEYRYFPHSTYKDQVDAGSGAFNKLKEEKIAGRAR